MSRRLGLFAVAGLLAAACGDRSSTETAPRATVQPASDAVVAADYHEVCNPPEIAPSGEALPRPQPVIQIAVVEPEQDTLIRLAREHATPDRRCGIEIKAAPGPRLKALSGLKGAIVEPTFGCDVLKSDPTDWRRSFWSIHLPPGAEATSKAALHELVKSIPAKSQGRIRAKLVPPAGPPGSDRFVGRSGKDEVTPETPCGTQWYLYDTEVVEAWKSADWPLPPDRRPAIFVADFGFYLDHNELDGDGLKARAYNSCDGSKKVSHGDQGYHGTAVLGLLAARQDGKGIMGVAHGAEVWPIQVICDPKSRISGDAWVEAVTRVRNTNVGDRPKVLLLEAEVGELGLNYEAANDALRREIAAAVAKESL